MTNLQHKIDFVGILSVERANANGDPLNGNRPRTDYNGFGEMSDVCIKRKIRNRMQDLGYDIFVQSNDRCVDSYSCLNDRAEGEMKDVKREDYPRIACEKWLDVRSFGQLFAFKKKSEKEQGLSIGIRGPVSIHQAVSVSPVEIESMQITKSVNGNKPKKGERSEDTMGMKHFVRFGVYLLKGSINVQLAEKTGFSQEDADVIKECLRTLFINDASSARPDGSMEVKRVYWWEHDCKDGQYSSAKVHRSVKCVPKENVQIPECFDDYVITIDPLPGLEPEVIDGI